MFPSLLICQCTSGLVYEYSRPPDTEEQRVDSSY